jgi:hypothetical protein
MRERTHAARLFIPLLRRLSTFRPRHLAPYMLRIPWLFKQLKFRFNFYSLPHAASFSVITASPFSPLSLRLIYLNYGNLALASASMPLHLMPLLLSDKNRKLLQFPFTNSSNSSSPKLQRSKCTNSTLLGLLNSRDISFMACMSIT